MNFKTHTPARREGAILQPSIHIIGNTSAALTRMPRIRGLKPHTARAHHHHGIVAHSVLRGDAHVAQTAELVVGNNNVALCLTLCPFACFLQACDSLAGVLRSCGTWPWGKLRYALTMRYRVLRRSSLACKQQHEGAHNSC
jgi:hypothetical protein